MATKKLLAGSRLPMTWCTRRHSAGMSSATFAAWEMSNSATCMNWARLSSVMSRPTAMRDWSSSDQRADHIM